MKKIINGILYDTNTSEKKGAYQLSFENGSRYYEEILYHTTKGNWFLFISGNPDWPAVGMQPDLQTAPFIKVLTEGEAKGWAEGRLSADEYCRIFGMPEQG